MKEMLMKEMIKKMHRLNKKARKSFLTDEAGGGSSGIVILCPFPSIPKLGDEIENALSSILSLSYTWGSIKTQVLRNTKLAKSFDSERVFLSFGNNKYSIYTDPESNVGVYTEFGDCSFDHAPVAFSCNAMVLVAATPPKENEIRIGIAEYPEKDITIFLLVWNSGFSIVPGSKELPVLDPEMKFAREKWLDKQRKILERRW